jgi:hypothetical protein
VTGRPLAPPPPQLVHHLASSVCGYEDARKSSQQSQGEVSTMNGLGGGHKPQGGARGPKENYSSTHNYDSEGAGEQGDEKERARRQSPRQHIKQQ